MKCHGSGLKDIIKHMKTNRRTFIGGAVAFAPLSGLWAADEKPLLKVGLITDTLTEHCGASWSLNSHTYERETGLFHWEWTFEV